MLVECQVGLGGAHRVLMGNFRVSVW